MKKHHKKTKHRRRQKHNNSKKTHKNRAGSPGMIHGEYHAPLVEYKQYPPGIKKLLGTLGFKEEMVKPYSKHFTYGYDRYDTSKPSIRERKLISPDRVIPRTLPNSQTLGRISIIYMKTEKPIKTSLLSLFPLSLIYKPQTSNDVRLQNNTFRKILIFFLIYQVLNLILQVVLY